MDNRAELRELIAERYETASVDMVGDVDTDAVSAGIAVVDEGLVVGVEHNEYGQEAHYTFASVSDAAAWLDAVSL